MNKLNPAGVSAKAVDVEDDVPLTNFFQLSSSFIFPLRVLKKAKRPEVV